MSAAAPPTPVERILLIGMMGAGKSTVGRLLSQRLRWPYLDSDDEITGRTGRSVAELWQAHGEATFRVEEAAVLRHAVQSCAPVVVAVAGGAVLAPGNRDVIKGGGLVVWLRARTETLVARVGAGDGRPLLGADPATALRTIYDARRPVYADLADVAVDVDGRTPEEIVEAVLAEREAPR